jgi:DNA-binding IclR family transcriptional regulator
MAHPYLTSFIRIEVVHQDSIRGHYDRGTLALRLGVAAFNRINLFQVADDEYRQFVARVNVDGRLSVWGDHGATLYATRSAQPILSSLRLGTMLPLSNLAPAASSSPSISRRRSSAEIRTGSSQKPSARGIAALAAKVRRDGYAWIDGQIFPSIRAIATPIFDMQSLLRGAMSLVSDQVSLVEFPNAVLEGLIDTAKRTSQRPGWRPDQYPQWCLARATRAGRRGRIKAQTSVEVGSKARAMPLGLVSWPRATTLGLLSTSREVARVEMKCCEKSLQPRQECCQFGLPVRVGFAEHGFKLVARGMRGNA